MQRRQFLEHAALLAAGATWTERAFSQNAWQPTRPVRIIAGAPGAILDVAARQLAEHMSGPLGQPITIENRGGAGGVLAMETLARAAPDGYTLGIASFVEIVINPWLFDKLSYDPVRDLAPVSLVYTGPQMLVAHPSFPANNLADLVKLAKGQPGKYAYGSSGVARPPHIFAEKFKATAGIDLQHIPFRGGPPLMQAVLGGEVPLAIEGTSATLPQVRSGKLKALGVTGDRRLAAMPQVPTFAESGFPGIGLAWVALLAPAGTPPAVVTRLQQEVASAVQTPEIRTSYEQAGRNPVGSSPNELADRIQRELPEWRALVKSAGIRPE